MAFFDSLESIAVDKLQSYAGSGDQAKVAGGLMQALAEHPGGIAGLVDGFKENGLEGCVKEWAAGDSATATPEQVQQGLGGSGLIEAAAEKAGVSPEVAQAAIATMLPLLIRHFAPNGETAPQSEFGGLAQQLLTRFL